MNILDTISTEKKQLLTEIIQKEFEMFSQVQNIGGRASCQDDFKTFYAMRFSQHSLFEKETLLHYKEDLESAASVGRNLIAEKYSWMMEETDPTYFERNLKGSLPPVGPHKAKLVESITLCFMSCYDAIRASYPHVIEAGRTPFGGAGGTSIQVYFSGELKTWSEETLRLASQDMIGLLQAHKNPVEHIYACTAAFYGYQSLQDADADLGGIIRLN